MKPERADGTGCCCCVFLSNYEKDYGMKKHITKYNTFCS